MASPGPLRTLEEGDDATVVLGTGHPRHIVVPCFGDDHQLGLAGERSGDRSSARDGDDFIALAVNDQRRRHETCAGQSGDENFDFAEALYSSADYVAFLDESDVRWCSRQNDVARGKLIMLRQNGDPFGNGPSLQRNIRILLYLAV